MQPVGSYNNGQQRGSDRKESDSRPSARRTASEAWSRLKPAQIDALQVYGFPSKGETRLNDCRTQEVYYNKIVERYLRFCAASGNGHDLDRRFSSLTVTAEKKSLQTSRWAKPVEAVTVPAAPSASNSAVRPLTTPSHAGRGILDETSLTSTELQAIFVAMRKLREALVATRRSDIFAQQAQIFIIRAAILTRSWESYLPAILYLLNTVHPKTPLSEQELHEFVLYYVLDLACRQSDFTAARAVKLKYGLRDSRLDMILKSLVDGNWVVFWKVRHKVDGYQRALLDGAVGGVRRHALKCLGRSYFTEEKQFVEEAAGLGWDELIKTGVGWDVSPDQTKVIIRRPKST